MGKNAKLFVDKRERENKKRKKEKEENEEERKERKSWSTLQEGRFFSYLGYPCLKAIQWPWSLAPTWGLVKKIYSLNANCVHFLGILMLEMDFWCRLNLLENTMDVGFLCTTVYCLENWKKKIPVCMCSVLV